MSVRGRAAGAALLTAALALGGSTACLVSSLERLGVPDEAARAWLRSSSIVFSKSDGIYIARGDASDARRLVSAGEVANGGAVFMPALAPDGRRLLFMSVADVDVRESTGKDLSLNVLDLGGSAKAGVRVASWRRTRMEKIAPPPAGGRQSIFTISGAAWSRDGERIALGLNREKSDGGDAVLVLDAVGSPIAQYPMQERRLPPVGAISWTADGGALVVGLEREDGKAGLVGRLALPPDAAPDGSASLVVLGPGRYPSISPDGKRIAVVDDAGGQWDVVLLGTDGRELDRFPRPAGRALHRPYWSADGRYLYYYSLASTGPLGLVEVTVLRCLDTRSRRVFDLVRLG